MKIKALSNSMNRKSLFFQILILLFVCSDTNGQIKVNSPILGLPPLLLTSKGKTIASTKMWMKERRPEILTLFEDNLYGQVPKDIDSLRFHLIKEDQEVMNRKATLKEISMDVYRNNQSVRIQILLFIPAVAQKPVPVFLLINHRGKDNTDPTRAVKSEF